MLKILWHIYKKGHSVDVNRGITIGLGDTCKGWLYSCDCGITHAR